MARTSSTLAHVVLGALLAAMPVRALHAQTADPRAEFLDALGRFSLALEGTYGDEGPRLAADVDAMTTALARWDASVQTRERAMAAELGTADPKLAARMHLALAGVYLDRLRISDAIKELAAARRSDATRPEPPLLQGLAYAQLTQDAAAATEALKAAHALNPNDPARTYLLAQHLMATKQQQAGLEMLQQIRAVPGAASGPAAPLFLRLDLVRETPGIDPFLPPVLYADGFASLQRGDLSRAIAQFRESLSRDPLTAIAASPDATVTRAAAALRDGNVKDARMLLEPLVAGAPGNGEVHRLLAMVDLADGENARAIDRLRTAVRLRPTDERTHVALAKALLDNDQLEDAERALTATLSTIASSGRAHYLLGLTYQRQGNRAAALRELEAARRLKPLLGANTIARMMGTLQQNEQDFDGAATAFADLVDLVPNDHDAHRDLGKVYFQQGEDVEARAEFEIALLLYPSDADALTALGQLQLRGGQYADAVNASRRALEIDPAHREARYLHATALIREGNVDEGNAEMLVFQRLQTEDSEARARGLELGRLRREASVSLASGDRANAVALLRRALVFEPRSATSHMDLGIALLESGQVAEALERLTTAAALNAPIEVHRHLAKAYGALGRNEESQKELATYERLRRESIRRTGRSQ